MDIQRVREILLDCFGGMDESQMHPLPGTELVDVFRVVPLQVAKVHQYEQEMIELLKAWPATTYGHPVPPLGEEINYLVAGAVLDDQGMAFIFFAFGALLNWWQILDPPRILGLAKDDSMSLDLVGRGFVSISGYTPKGQ